MMKHSCQVYVYTPNDIFQVSPPEFLPNQNNSYWDLGFIDVFNIKFYELGHLVENSHNNRLYLFDLLVSFMQNIIDLKLYNNLFEKFGFKSSNLIGSQRFLPEPIFFNNLKNYLNFQNVEDDQGQAIIDICNLFKNYKDMISFTIFKKKISSNLKNFKDLQQTIKYQ